MAFPQHVVVGIGSGKPKFSGSWFRVDGEVVFGFRYYTLKP